MKRTPSILKCFLLTIALIALVTNVYSQDEQVYTKQELKQLAKEDRKAKKEAEDTKKREATELMLNAHKFVLEANYISNGKGQRTPVSSNINFIAVDSLKAVIQLGTTQGIGYNGLGGITVDGRITKYELSVIQGKKSKSYNLMLNVMTSIGIYDISLMVSELGSANATIRGNTSGQLQYSGNLVPIGISRVYKGTSIF
jgi:hypothetical protein